jgi:hypothetical protein
MGRGDGGRFGRVGGDGYFAKDEEFDEAADDEDDGELA